METGAGQLRNSLGYPEATIMRTSYTYNVFVKDYCTFEDNDTASRILKDGIEKANKAYENGVILKDKLLRIRRLAPILYRYALSTGKA